MARWKTQKQMLFDAPPIKGRIALGHGRMDSPRFEFIEDGFGAVAHELGHALGLPHDNRRDDLYLMGNGFRNLRWNFAEKPDPRKRVRFSDDNARIPYPSRYLASDLVLADRQAPTVKMRWAAPPKVGVAATDHAGLRAILIFSSAQDSVGGGRVNRQATGFRADVECFRVEGGAVSIGDLGHGCRRQLDAGRVEGDCGIVERSRLRKPKDGCPRPFRDSLRGFRLFDAFKNQQ